MPTWLTLSRLSPAGNPRAAALAGAAAVMAVAPFAPAPFAIAAPPARAGQPAAHSASAVASTSTKPRAAALRRNAAVLAARSHARAASAATASRQQARAASRRAVARRAAARPSARAYARATVGATQYGCLNALWTRESRWKTRADNPSSRAYGIPQALPGKKMAAAGPDWRTNPVTQVRWGLGYIDHTYGSPCAAWRHSQRLGWY